MSLHVRIEIQALRACNVPKGLSSEGYIPGKPILGEMVAAGLLEVVKTEVVGGWRVSVVSDYRHWSQKSCECNRYELDLNWEPLDPPGWEGGFAPNHCDIKT